MSKAEESKDEVENDFGKMSKSTSAHEEISRMKKDKNYKPLYARRQLRFLEKPREKPELSILQFNILADGLSGYYEPDGTKKVFCDVPRECLHWSYRGPRILEEVVRFKPDIITFEEMDQIGYFKRYLGNDYDCQWMVNKKSPCLKVGQLFNHKLLPDGVAIFYHKRRVACLDVKKFDAEKMSIDVGGMILHMQLLGKEREFLMAVLHLKSAKDTEGEKIRLKQLSAFLPAAKKYQEEKEKGKKIKVPLFIGCDLNGPPIRSKEFEPFAYGSIISYAQFHELVELHNKSAEKPEDKLDEKDFGYTDKWGVDLSSAYADALKEEPAYTTWKKRPGGTDKHTVDYIFYQQGKGVNLTSYLEIPDESVVNQDTLLPGWEYPSDHFSIFATFEF